jgi:hypothetical protein
MFASGVDGDAMAVFSEAFAWEVAPGVLILLWPDVSHM